MPNAAIVLLIACDGSSGALHENGLRELAPALERLSPASQARLSGTRKSAPNSARAPSP